MLPAGLHKKDGFSNERPDGCARKDIAWIVQAENDAGKGDKQRERHKYRGKCREMGDGDDRFTCSCKKLRWSPDFPQPKQ